MDYQFKLSVCSEDYPELGFEPHKYAVDMEGICEYELEGEEEAGRYPGHYERYLHSEPGHFKVTALELCIVDCDGRERYQTYKNTVPEKYAKVILKELSDGTLVEHYKEQFT